MKQVMVEFHHHNWSNDPFTRMAYSYVPVDQLETPRQLAEPVDNTLFFAGEATSLEAQNGTVHGALNSGLRAANEVARSLGIGRNEFDETRSHSEREWPTAAQH